MSLRSILASSLLVACSAGDPSTAGGPDAAVAVDGSIAARGQVHVVLFTHVEDNTPGGTLGSAQSRQSYATSRQRLLDTAQRFRARNLPWVLQPDWKLLEAARLYEDAATTSNTSGKNVFRYLREDLGVVIDPHSHENGGYNYTDVAYLLEQLGVGGSTVIGGHIWDPTLVQFSAWDRFRVPVAGEKYPTATWRGDLLIGAGTPNHVNDPVASGVWRPADRDHYFTDDPAGNIVSVGAWHDDAAGVQELVQLYASGAVPPDQMLTASWNVNPTALADLDAVDATVLAPIAALRDSGDVVVGDFRALVDAWRASGARAAIYQP